MSRPVRSGRPLRLLVLTVTLLTLLVVLLRVSGSAEEAGVTAAEQPGESVEAPLLQPDRVERTRLGRGGTLDGALDRLGVRPELKSRLLEVAAGFLDPKRLAAESGLSIRRDGSGRLVSLALRGERERFVRIILGEDDSLRAELLRVPVRATLETASGVVASSVAQSLSTSIHGPRLTREFADIFQWDIDMMVDPRPGDAVALVFELLRMGQPPLDLPAFGGPVEEEGEIWGVGRILAARYEGSVARASAFWVEGNPGSGDFFDDQGVPLRKAFLKSPLNYRRISSGFSSGRLHPVTRRVVPHHGVDFAAARGTPVVATADGRIESAGWAGALGKAVRIRHNSEYTTIYGHLHRFARGIRPGTRVRQNQVIGYVGSTGRATGPHVHYTVRRNGKPIDPLRMTNPPAKPLDPALRPWLDAAVRRWLPRLRIPAQETGTGYET